ncbi:Diguanylate cyclase DgcM [Rhodocyclaceae bacterium]|nr:Diguanylate cyclase DgcM [Rhodocyclaceae bacterium]
MPLINSDDRIPLKALLKRFVLIYLSVMAIFLGALMLSIRFDDQRRLERLEERESSLIEITKWVISHDFSEVNANLRVVAGQPALRWYLDSGNAAQREEVANLFLVLSREAGSYDQVRYIDASGQEVIRVDYNDGSPAIVPQDMLQNKAERYYFRDTLKLNQGETFVSPLDLNIEHDRLEMPYKPVIRFGTPVFDSQGNKKGVILLNYLGGELIQFFRNSMKMGDGHSAMLLNRDGYWLSSSRPEDEWGFMLGRSERTFGHDFPAEWRDISAGEQGALRTAKGLFIYTTVYPLSLGQHSSTGSALARAPSERDLTAEDYLWKIVSFVPHEALSRAAFYNQTDVRILFVIACLAIAAAAWIVAHITLSRERARADLAASKARYDELVRNSPVGVYLLHIHADGSMRLEYASPVFCRILGLDANAVLRDASAAFAAVHPDDRDRLIRSSQEAVTSLKPFRWEGRFIIDSETRWIRISSDPMPQPGGGSLWSGVISNISERKKLEHELERQARIDVLTGLNNRRHFFELAEQELARIRRHAEPLSLLMLDLDRFKSVNDTYGHAVGDEVLKKLGEVSLHTMREIDILGRLGGEEFVVLLPETTGERALEVAERLRSAIADAAVPLEDGSLLRFTVSIGVTSLAATDTTVGAMINRADAAMYRAKNEGRNRVCGEGIA